MWHEATGAIQRREGREKDFSRRRTYNFGFWGRGTDSAKQRGIMGSSDFFPEEVDVKLDGTPIAVPSERRSFNAIRSYLESLALQQQRLLCWLSVDGEPVNLTQPRRIMKPFVQVEGETMSLNEVPVQLIKAALQQTGAVRSRVQSAVELVLINDQRRARELWWTLATALKEPLLTLSLLPETICGPDNGRAPLMQLRKWQLQQLGCVIKDVDEACHSEDTAALSEALEKRALPWLDKLHQSLELWQEAVASNPRTVACHEK